MGHTMMYSRKLYYVHELNICLTTFDLNVLDKQSNASLPSNFKYSIFLNALSSRDKDNILAKKISISILGMELTMVENVVLVQDVHEVNSRLATFDPILLDEPIGDLPPHKALLI